jgi:hypothetical protein
MAPQASKKCGFLPPHHQQLGCCMNDGVDSEQVPGTFLVLTSSSVAPQASARSEKMLVVSFSNFDSRSERCQIVSSTLLT